MKKVSWALLVAGILVAGTVGAEEQINDRDALDLLRYIELQILAVDNDVYLPLGWSDGDKKMIRQFAVDGTKKLTRLRDKLMGMDLSAEVEPVRGVLAESIDRLAVIYRDLEKKDNKTIRKAYEEQSAFYEASSKIVGPIYARHLDPEKMPDGFDPVTEEIRFADTKTDGKKLLRAVSLTQEGDPSEAIRILEDLRGRYKDRPFWGAVTLRLSDAYSRREASGEDIDNTLSLLLEILDADLYSPTFFEAYEKWRSREQMMNHGMSNMSAIPNGEYNLKRLKVMITIKNYLKTHPGDRWARAQINHILGLPNINRGGEYGNDNIMDVYRLYGESAL